MHDQDPGERGSSAYRGNETLRHGEMRADGYEQTTERQGPKNDSMGTRSAH